ncbi:DNA polymerase III, clamp loader complex, gamma/delta/delta subunit [Geopyxis carbonaria]|nr:DNA polymerase III, clamp loader complex, gamma/delta/delta subunit [Geopyxis carbonaria]
MVSCPVCEQDITISSINDHLDSGCTTPNPLDTKPKQKPERIASIFQTPNKNITAPTPSQSEPPTSPVIGSQHKRSFDEVASSSVAATQTKRPKATTAQKLRLAMPLAEKMRPQTLNDICGQDLVGPDGVLRGLIEDGRVPSIILWGSAGCGKTTIARVIAGTSGARFVEISATASGVQECKKIFAEARSELVLTGRKTILFCDEIHRFTKVQQDIFLFPVERGEITLIGATTENPSFKVQSALLSRCRTFTLKKLTQSAVESIIHRALVAESPPDSEGNPVISDLLDQDMTSYLARFADGDARTALNLLELAMNLSTRDEVSKDDIKEALTRTLVYDRSGDMHYDTISAFHKSVRGSDPDAALFWLARMLKGGEDPLFIARRMVVMASEDIGLADNSLLGLATATFTAVQQVGLPEARINMAHCAVALAMANKSTRAYRGLGKAMELIERDPVIGGAAVPIHLRNAPTKLMKDLGYGKEYKYNPDYLDGKVVQDYLPEELKGVQILEDRHLGTKIDPDLNR